jgi:carboxylesterase
MRMIQNGGEPFYFQGGPVGCLLVHGFTGAPKEMLDLGRYLADQGHTVHAVRLFGHATRVEQMPRARWQDWLASVEDGYQLLSGQCDHVVIMGLSMGGILSLTLAARFPVCGVVAMSTPFSLPADPRLRFVRLLSLFVKRIEKGESDWLDPDAEADHLDYPYYPTRSIAELRNLVDEMQAGLARLTVPVLIIHSKTDQGVPPHNAENLLNALGSKDKSLVWIERSGHVITRDLDRQRVFELAGAFVQKVAGAKA